MNNIIYKRITKKNKQLFNYRYNSIITTKLNINPQDFTYYAYSKIWNEDDCMYKDQAVYIKYKTNFYELNLRNKSLKKVKLIHSFSFN